MKAAQVDSIKDQLVQRKAKRMAWITGFTLPAVYVLASGGVIASAGLGGFAVLLMIYLPAIPICAVLLRLALTPVYRILLDRGASSQKRKVVVGILAVLAVVYAILLIKILFFPYSNSVNDAVENISQIEQYFHEHKDELEIRRLESAGGEKRFTEVYSSYPQYPAALHIELCYDAQGAEQTGYQSSSSYTHALDNYWYIHIWI